LPNISEAGVERFGTALSKYKEVSDDITKVIRCEPVQPVDHLKSMKKFAVDNGRGAVVIFYNYKNAWQRSADNAFPGEFTYITENPCGQKVLGKSWYRCKFDDKGRAIITAKFDGPGAKIIFFGVD
jgi:hypothetical protein